MPDLGWPEVLIIIVVVLLLFGGKKLPEMARGTGRALRIFKAETKGLMDDDDKDSLPQQPTAAPPVQTQPMQAAPPPEPPAQSVAPTQPTGDRSGSDPQH